MPDKNAELRRLAWRRGFFGDATPGKPGAIYFGCIPLRGFAASREIVGERRLGADRIADGGIGGYGGAEAEIPMSRWPSEGIGK